MSGGLVIGDALRNGLVLLGVDSAFGFTRIWKDPNGGADGLLGTLTTMR